MEKSSHMEVLSWRASGKPRIVDAPAEIRTEYNPNKIQES
jgi:hypothetical protein